MNREHTRSSKDRQFAKHIVQKLHDSGFTAYFAGGCVRDQLLGIEPHDFDVATSATPKQVCDLFGARKTSFVGAAFGVVCIHERIEGESLQVEVATFRSDGSYSDGRRPDSVVFTSPEEDAQRRDFTINGLFYDPLEETVIDFVGGVEDLHGRVLRAIGDPHLRFSEDKLRLLRAIRFAARFQLQLDLQTEEAIRSMSKQIDIVSPERIAMELRKTMVLPLRAWAIEKLLSTGLLAGIFPELARHFGSHPSHFEIAKSALENLSKPTFAQSLVAILHPVSSSLKQDHVDGMELDRSRKGIRKTERVFEPIFLELKERWKLSNEEIDDAIYFGESLRVLTHAENEPWSSVQPLLADARSQGLLKLAEALSAFPQSRIDHYKQVINRPRSEWDPPQFLNGGDLKKLGFSPSPLFAKILQELRNQQLNGFITSSDHARQWVLDRYSPEG